MQYEEICSEVKKIIKGQTNLDLQNNDLLLDKGVDSLSLINIVIEIENYFDIEIDPEDLNYKTLKSITDIANCIIRLQS
jgi:acyl carrier protein